MSPLPCLPVPIHPIFILSLGGFFPITDEGMMVGITTVPAAATMVFEINFLLFISILWFILKCMIDLKLVKRK
jgi:hypothetical protein